MDQELSKIVQELTVQESKLQGELEEASGRAKAYADRLGQVQQALSALRGTGQLRSTGVESKKNRPTATPLEVENAVVAILKQRGNLSKSEVMNAVKSQVLAQGRSRAGFKPLFTKTIASSRFKIDHDEIVSIA